MTITTPQRGYRIYGAGLVDYDAERKRIWVGGQRLHHGLTGALLAGVGFMGLLAHQITPRGSLEWAIFGSVLMAHDWHDRSHWFEVGHQGEE